MAGTISPLKGVSGTQGGITIDGDSFYFSKWMCKPRTNKNPSTNFGSRQGEVTWEEFLQGTTGVDITAEGLYDENNPVLSALDLGINDSIEFFIDQPGNISFEFDWFIESIQVTVDINDNAKVVISGVANGSVTFPT